MATENERDSERDFENEQDMSVLDKTHPALGPTERSQDVATLAQQVVPMPAFNDPHNPIAASGSVNLSLDDHPVSHSEDYGQSVIEAGHDQTEHPMSEASRGLQEFDQTGASDEARAALANADLPEDRGAWQKKDWQSAARAYELSTSGNVETLRDRVEAHEAEAAKTPEDRRAEEVAAANELSATDWRSQVEAAESVEALDELQSLYDDSDAEYSTVESAFESKRAEFADEA